jgi:hypothetical protein
MKNDLYNKSAVRSFPRTIVALEQQGAPYRQSFTPRGPKSGRHAFELPSVVRGTLGPGELEIGSVSIALARDLARSTHRALSWPGRAGTAAAFAIQEYAYGLEDPKDCGNRARL